MGRDIKDLQFVNPIIKADGNAILVGLELYTPNPIMKLLRQEGETNLEDGIVDLINILKEADQKVCAQVSLGASIKDILSEEEKDTPLLKHLAKGFKVST